MNLTTAFSLLRPDSKWLGPIDWTSLETISKSWVDDGREMPTIEECKARWDIYLSDEKPIEDIHIRLSELNEILPDSLEYFIKMMIDKEKITGADLPQNLKDAYSEKKTLKEQLS